ncbi:MAG: hypothetical protein ACK4ON_02765, partial [Bacteroidia bacterium]
MVNKSQHTIPSKEKLLDFVRGELSAKERIDIEKAIEEDPVWADVDEGLRLSLNREKNILELEQALRKKYQNSSKGRIISFQSKAILAVAASVLILISFGIYNKMLKLDEGSVVSEQTFKNTKAPTKIIKTTKGSVNSQNSAEAESAHTPETITPNFNLTDQQKSKQKNIQEKAAEKTEIANKLDLPTGQTKEEQELSTNSGAVLADKDKYFNAKRDASAGNAVNDNTTMGNSPTPASASSTIIKDIPKKEGINKNNTGRYRSAEQDSAVIYEMTEEKESAQKSLAREAP